MSTTIEHQIEVAAAPAAVLAALTTADGLRAWWARDCDIGDGVGATHELRFDKGANLVTMSFEVTAAGPDRVAWTCTANSNPIWPGTTLTWIIAPRDGGSAVSFEHAGFAEAGSPPYEMTAAGWQHFMGSLKSYLDGGDGRPW